MLRTSAVGFGQLALAALMAHEGIGGEPAGLGNWADPLLPKAPHFPPRAQRVIFLFMKGGPSQVDTFDLWRWSRLALGPKGAALGWAPFVKKAIRSQALRNFESWRAQKKR